MRPEKVVVPAAAGLRAARDRVRPGGRERAPPGRRRGRLDAVRRHRRRRARPVRLPRQRDRAAAPLRQDRGSRPGGMDASPSARPTTPPRRRQRSPRRSSGCAAASGSASSSAPATAPAPARAQRSSTSSTSSSSCAPASVRDKADITWITNEYELGDFGMGGMHLRRGGYVTPSEHLHRLALRRARHRLDHACARPQGRAAAGSPTRRSTASRASSAFDFAMLLPPFSGVGPEGVRPCGLEITERAVPAERVHARRRRLHAKPYEEWRAADWPRTYQSPEYPNVFAAGIAFAPPHADLAAVRDPERRAGRPGPAAYRNAVGDDRQGGRPHDRRHDPRRRAPDPHSASMAEMGAACVASAGANPFTRHRRLDDRLPDRARLRALSRSTAATSAARSARSASPATGSRSCSTTCSSTRPPPARLAPDPGVAMARRQARHVTKPTRGRSSCARSCRGSSGASPRST